MKQIEIEPLGVKTSMEVPATVEEFDSLAKKSGAALEAALRYHLYHVHFTDLRDIILHGREEVKDEATGAIVQSAITGMEDAFGVERLTQPATDKAGKPIVRDGKPVMEYAEKEAPFFKRIVAEKKISDADLKTFVQAIVDQVAFDPTVAERTPRAPTKLAAVWLENAKKFFAGGKLAELSKRLHKSIGQEFVPTAKTGDTAVDAAAHEKDLDRLGRLLKQFSEWAAKEAMAKQMAQLGGVEETPAS